MIRLLTASICIAALSACSSAKENHAALDRVENFRCANGAQLTYAAWGASGVSKECRTKEGVQDGDYLTAENGLLFLKGSYSQGLMDGRWEWFDENGRVTRTEIYVAGKQKK